MLAAILGRLLNRSQPVARNRRRAPRLEALEDRLLLSGYFVSTTGQDNNSGTSPQQPFRTIQHALDVATAPGDTISVRGGTFHEKIAFPASGSAGGGFITLQAHPGEHPVLDGTGVAGSDMVLIQDRSYVRISGLEIENNLGVNDGSGIRVLGAGSHVELLGNIIHAMHGTSAMGITVYGTSVGQAIANLVINGNELYDCQPSPSEALTLNGNVTQFQITNNRVHDVNNIGIDMIGGEKDVNPSQVARNGEVRGNVVYHARSNYGGGYADGIYVDGGKNITIEDNITYANDQGIEVGAENAGIVASGMIVRNNLIYHNDKAGLVFGGYDASRGRVSGSWFVNNVLYDNDTLEGGYGQLDVNYGSGNVVTNNILWASGDDVFLDFEGGASTNRLDYNLWYNADGRGGAQFIWNGTTLDGFDAYRQSTRDAHSLFASPRFVNAEAGNFHLQAGSPAIGAGSAAKGEFSPTDFNGVKVPPGRRPNIGAFEA